MGAWLRVGAKGPRSHARAGNDKGTAPLCGQSLSRTRIAHTFCFVNCESQRNYGQGGRLSASKQQGAKPRFIVSYSLARPSYAHLRQPHGQPGRLSLYIWRGCCAIMCGSGSLAAHDGSRACAAKCGSGGGGKENGCWGRSSACGCGGRDVEMEHRRNILQLVRFSFGYRTDR